MTHPIVLVTGGSRGIGAAVAIMAAQRGYDVAFSYQSKAKAAEAVAGTIRATGRKVLAMQADVSVEADVLRLFKTVDQQMGRLDALVNNAGIGRPKPMHLTDDAELDRFLGVNLRSVFRFSREALGLMQPGACMVHVASTFGLMGNPGASAYAATKAALIGLTRQMAVDYGPQGLRINAVAPGLIRTALIEDRLDQPAFRRLMVDTIPYPRLGEPADVAAGVAFLCSQDAAFINGHVLVIDGGWSATNWVGSTPA